MQREKATSIKPSEHRHRVILHFIIGFKATKPNPRKICEKQLEGTSIHGNPCQRVSMDLLGLPLCFSRHTTFN